MQVPRSWWFAAAAILVVRTLLLVASVPPHARLTGDEPIYDEVARNLAGGVGYWYRGEPWVWKPPGWPLALAGIYRIFGDERRVVVLCQGLFDAGTALLYAATAALIYRNRAAIAATFLVVCAWPPFFRESRFLQTEPLFTLSVALMVASFVRLTTAGGRTRALWTGVCAGVASLVRPTGLIPLGGLVIGQLLTRRHARGPRAGALALIALGVALVLAPWTLRNAAVFHAFIPVSTGGGELFFMGTTPETEGRWDPRMWPSLTGPVLAREQQRLGHPVGPLDRDRALMRAGIENWRRMPVTSARIAIKRLWRLCFVPLGAGDQGWLRWGFFGVLVVCYWLAIRQGIAGFRSADPGASMSAALLVAAGFYVLVSSVFYTNGRYFEPVRPLLLVLAVGGAMRFPDANGSPAAQMRTGSMAATR